MNNYPWLPPISRVEKALALAILVLLAACTDQHPAMVGEKVVYQPVKVEVPRPCPVTKPVRPAPLARPLPVDPARLVDLLAAKLLEYVGPGGFADKADAAISTCVKP